MPRLTTFDVFDTLLTRRVAEPHAMFLALGVRLASAAVIPISAEAFARQRARAEQLAWSFSPTGHSMLADIYAVLATQLDMSPEWAARTAEVELDVERELIVPVPGAVERVAEARAQGRVAFISDMYLSSGFIRSLLEQHEIIAEGEPLFVSAELGMSKWDGSLFTHTLTALGAAGDGSDVVHVGDNEVADIARPRSLGIEASPFTDARPNRYETQLEAHRWSTQGLASALAGASRHTRLSVAAATPHERVVRDVAAGVAAPFLVGYVLWVLHRARVLGLRRLYFVARDGEVLLDLARILDRNSPEPLELRYLYGSRQSWYPAGADPERPIEALRQLESHGDSLRNLLERCGVAAEKWIDPNADPDDQTDLKAEIERLGTNPEFLSEVTAGLRGRQDRLLRYARQSGLLDGQVHGLVDVGWFRRSFTYISDLLESRGGARPIGFYVGSLMDPGRPMVPQGAVSEVWLKGSEDRLAGRVPMIEAFTAGSEGSVLDFEVRSDGTVQPKLRSDRNESAIDWGLAVLRDSYTQFAEFFADTGVWWPEAADCRAAALDGFELFWNDPSVAEARAWGDFPYEAAAVAAQPALLAAPRGLRAHLSESLRREKAFVVWYGGDQALVPDSWTPLLRTTRVTGRVLRRLRHELRRLRGR